MWRNEEKDNINRKMNIKVLFLYFDILKYIFFYYIIPLAKINFISTPNALFFLTIRKNYNIKLFSPRFLSLFLIFFRVLLPTCVYLKRRNTYMLYACICLEINIKMIALKSCGIFWGGKILFFAFLIKLNRNF